VTAKTNKPRAPKAPQVDVQKTLQHLVDTINANADVGDHNAREFVGLFKEHAAGIDRAIERTSILRADQAGIASDVDALKKDLNALTQAAAHDIEELREARSCHGDRLHAVELHLYALRDRFDLHVAPKPTLLDRVRNRWAEFCWKFA
jgi:uncharacterized membrane protein YccC